MATNFESLRNYYERQVFEQILQQVAKFPLMSEDHLPDVACVALNRLPPRYIRHEVDLAFYLTEKERQENERLVAESVAYAFEFVQARFAMRARR